MFMWVIIQPHIYAETVSRIHTLHTMHNIVCVRVYVCVFVCYLNKNPNWCAGTKCNIYSMYVKSRYSYGLEGKAIAFL